MRAVAEPASVDAKTTAAVAFDGVSIAFEVAGGPAYTAVKGVDLEIGDGAFVAIVGPTGCGKSTLLNVAAGLLTPSAGTCRIFGEALDQVNRKAGYLFQADALMPWKTAHDNVAVGLEIRGVSRREAKQRSAEWLKRVGLSAFLDRYPHQLSGGQRKRVALAQVLLLDPKLLLMDEPFGPLDAQTRQLMGELLLSLWSADRKAVLFVTHDLEEAIALADRVVIMAAGPASTVIGDYEVGLGRPRDPAEIRHTPEFGKIHHTIWTQLKEEVLKAYQHGDQR